MASGALDRQNAGHGEDAVRACAHFIRRRPDRWSSERLRPALHAYLAHAQGVEDVVVGRSWLECWAQGVDDLARPAARGKTEALLARFVEVHGRLPFANLGR